MQGTRHIVEYKAVSGIFILRTICGAFRQEVVYEMKKAKVKAVRSKLREDLKDPKFRAQYMEKQRILKLAEKIAMQREIKKV